MHRSVDPKASAIGSSHLVVMVVVVFSPQSLFYDDLGRGIDDGTSKDNNTHTKKWWVDRRAMSLRRLEHPRGRPMYSEGRAVARRRIYCYYCCSRVRACPVRLNRSSFVSLTRLPFETHAKNTMDHFIGTNVRVHSSLTQPPVLPRQHHDLLLHPQHSIETSPRGDE
jgi:hypothetical protein